MTARDLFISHSSGDGEVARALRGVLEDAGYTCWMAPDDIVGTETWTEQILGAIADSKAMIVLVSAASNKSQHVSREVNLALGKARPVLPIRIEDVAPGGSLEYLLSLVQRVDAFPPPMSVHRDRILRRLDTIVERPKPFTPTDATTTVATSPPPPPPLAGYVPTEPQTAASPIRATPTEVVLPGHAVGTSTNAPERRLGGRTGLLLGAGAAVVVAAIVLGTGLLNGPGSSPKPTEGAIASGTAVSPPGTSTPTDPPMTINPTAAPLSADQQQLFALLPAIGGSGTSTCVAWSTAPGAEDVLSPSGYGASIARLSCGGPEAGGPDTHFALYRTKDALQADYASIMTDQGVANGGSCTSAIPANAPWSFPDYPDSGDLACFARGGGVQYVWTQRELRILGQWLAPDNPTGLAFWQRWTTVFNPAETALLALLPATVDDAGACIRAADRYYETALAIIACPKVGGGNAVYYASFASAEAFPNDPATLMFDSIMTGGGFPDDTTTGCYDEDPVYGRYTWGYATNGNVGDTEGYLGCYQRTDSDPATAQFLWTFNRSGVMGLWNAPDLLAGIGYFDTWIGEVR